MITPLEVAANVRRGTPGAVLDAGDSGADGATRAVVTDSVIKSLNVHIKA